MRMVERELTDGEHIRPTENTAYRGIGRSHFHSAAELCAELADGGFPSAVHGVVGAAWLAPELDALWADSASREALMRTVRPDRPPCGYYGSFPPICLPFRQSRNHI